MKCPHCAREWFIPGETKKTVQYCPFCGSILPERRSAPADAVCRPEDYRITNGILLKYLGADRIIAVPRDVVAIDTRAFQNCGIREVFLPDGLTVIGMGSFEGCHLLRKISLRTV